MFPDRVPTGAAVQVQRLGVPGRAGAWPGATCRRSTDGGGRYRARSPFQNSAVQLPVSADVHARGRRSLVVEPALRGALW